MSYENIANIYLMKNSSVLFGWYRLTLVLDNWYNFFVNQKMTFLINFYQPP